MIRINWDTITLVIVDVDGTLYHQEKLRMIMALEIIGYYSRHPRQLYDIAILRTFRNIRAALAHTRHDDQLLSRYQYHAVAEILRVDTERITAVVDEWIIKKPLRFLKSCLFPGVHEFMQCCAARGIAVAAFSDYPAKEKLNAMGLKISAVYCSTDERINAFKPDPKGLLVIMHDFNVEPRQCLYIGDRQSVDGECADAAGMHFIRIPHHFIYKTTLFRKLCTQCAERHND
jgi:phosphoglycolate phosphatase/putative hydrolase of the HAD superfamily